MEEQDDLGEIAALNFRCVSLVAALLSNLGPEAMAGSACGSPGPAFSLVSAGLADGFELEGSNSALGIVSGNAGDSAVHDVADSVDRDAGFGNICGNDDFAQRVWGESAVLFLRFESAVKGDAGNLFLGSQAAKGIEGSVDFALTGHEDEDVSIVSVVDNAFDGGGSLSGDGALIGEREIVDLDGEALSFGKKNGAVFEVLRNGFGIEGGGHHEHGEIRALVFLEILDQGESDIAEEVSLVKFIEHDGSDFGKLAVILQPAQQNALGDEADAGGRSGAVVEADLITDFAAQFDLSLRGDSCCHGSCGHPSWLQNDDEFVSADFGVAQHLRDLGRLSRPGWCDENEAISVLQRAQDVIVDLPDGKGVLSEVFQAFWTKVGEEFDEWGRVKVIFNDSA